jgi:hypothetical protein
MDKSVLVRPEVTLVVEATALSRGAERLAGARSSPDRSIIRPSRKAECTAPSTDTSEEVALDVADKIVGPDVDNASFVDVSGRDVSGGDEVSEPCGGIRIDLVVIGGHLIPTPIRP